MPIPNHTWTYTVRIYCIYHIYQLGTYIHAISVLKECLLYTKYLYSENVYNQGMYYFIMF